MMFRLQESGLGSQDILSEKPWKLRKKYWNLIFKSGKKGDICFLSFVSGNLGPKKIS